MAKHSFEFKRKIVYDYLSGQGGSLFLAKKYGFKDSSQIMSKKKRNEIQSLPSEHLCTNIKGQPYLSKYVSERNLFR